MWRSVFLRDTKQTRTCVCRERCQLRLGQRRRMDPGSQIAVSYPRTSPHFPQRKMHTLVRSKKHYIQRREWQPISSHPDRPFYLSLGLSLVPLLPHPAFTVNHKQMRALIWVLEKLYHLFLVELKRYFLIFCPQMTGWTLLNYEGKWGRCWLGKP